MARTSRVELGGGSQAVLEISFDPVSEGPAEGLLVIELDGARREIPITGSAVMPPPCAASEPCVVSTFDPDLGECVTSIAADDTACSVSACVSDGRCKSGVCVGELVGCDDGNPCTLDACDAEGGCVHLDGLDACPAPTSPCQAAFCDPTTGCGFAPVSDGTACGPADCATARVCLEGACTTSPVPDGAACGTESPCQPAGVCQGQVCQQPDATPLAPVWSYGPVHQLHFNGVADDQENLFWSECPKPTAGCQGASCPPCELVSVDRDGIERWRVALPFVSGPVQGARSHMLSADVLVAFVGQTVIEGRRSSDGALLWRLDLSVDLALPGLSVERTVSGHSSSAQGSVYVPLEVEDSNMPFDDRLLLLAIDASTGAIRWTARLAGPSAITAVDQVGNLYVGGTKSTGGFVGSFTASGLVRWETATKDFSYVSVNAGELMSSVGDTFDSSSGAVLWTSPETLSTSLLASGTSWSFYRPTSVAPSTLVRRDAKTGTQKWIAELGELGSTSFAITADDRTLIAGWAPISLISSSWLLTEVDSNGDRTFTCTFDKKALIQALTLLRDRVVVLSISTSGGSRVEAFDVPGRVLRSTGWVTDSGNNARSAAAK